MKLPSIQTLIELHGESLEAFGGAAGLRDRGALEASLARAEHILSYAEPPPDAVDIACAVCVSLRRNHPFVDGNKRIAFIALGVILELNGRCLDARETEAADMMMRLANGDLPEPEINAWVRANTPPLTA